MATLSCSLPPTLSDGQLILDFCYQSINTSFLMPYLDSLWFHLQQWHKLFGCGILYTCRFCCFRTAHSSNAVPSLQGSLPSTWQAYY
ncbi:unnamed protein product [Linum trigynum]|uniref:Uncharacterized protein n=1 Tax=Linum trigynum TaxID=586398 RepID=A0AAV2F553_9ROSI